MIEPPVVSNAFVNMGDVEGAVAHGERTLTFVEFCHILNPYLAKVQDSAELMTRSLSAVTRSCRDMWMYVSQARTP